MSSASNLSQLRAEMQQRWRAGEYLPVEFYLAQQPALRDDASGVVDLIILEIFLREEKGETPDADEYYQRFHEYADLLRIQFDLHSDLRARGGPVACDTGSLPSATSHKDRPEEKEANTSQGIHWLAAEADLRRRQEELHAWETRLRLIYEQAPAILWTTDTALRFTSSKGLGLRSLGLQTDQVAGLSLYDFFQTEDPMFPPIQAHLQALQGQAVSYEQVWLGQVFQVRVEPLHDPEKGIMGCTGVALEITDRKRAEENLQRSHEALNQKVAQRTAALAKANEALEQLLGEQVQVAEELHEQNEILQAILDGTTDAIYVKDLQGRYLLINPAGARFLGRPVEEILGQDDRALFSPESAAAIMAQDRWVLTSGRTQTVEEVGTVGGQTLIYLSTKGPYRDNEGRLIGLFGISRDISDRKRSERRLAAEHAVARALGASANLAEAAPRIIKVIGENLGWTTGAVWSFDRHAQLLRCQGFWHFSTHPVPEFEALTRAMVVPPGTNLVGQAWSTGQSVWLTDITQAPSFLRVRAAARVGLHTLLATPILSENAVLGVLEFGDVAVREPDAELLDMLSLYRQPNCPVH